MAGDGITKITDLKEELTSLHTGLLVGGYNKYYNRRV